MKTCLHRLLPTAILSLSSLAQPLIAQTTELYNVPNTRNDPVAINIDQSFQPFGNRPITDKTAEDGSVAIRDENGVIIWTDNRGRAARIPNSSQAKTLFVSNSECVIWQNRYDGTYNARGSTTQIILYRRDENGAVTAMPTITIDGTVMDTSPVSPGTYGFTFLAGVTFDNGTLESRQRFQSGVGSDGKPTYDTKDVNQWSDNILTLYRITWDGKLQTLERIQYDVPKSSGNNIGGDALANGSDGSFFFTATTALDLYDDSTIPSAENPNTDPDPGIFKSQQVGVWVITSQDGERIQQVVSSSRLPTGAAHVTNSRLLIETQEGANFRIRDFRKLTNGSISETTAFNLPAGERLLSVAGYTRDGLPVRFYTIANETDIKLYNADASAPHTAIGAGVSLPNKFLSGSGYVRNPRDSSLLLKMDGGSLAWIRGGDTGLNAPQVLTNSQQAMPLFVSKTESVAWMNSGAPPVITPSGVSLPIAKISHFNSSLAATDLTASSPTITSPIAGRYVALTPSLTPDAKDEGWFISTFIKSNDRAAVMRTYTLVTISLSDTDRDALPDAVETNTNTYVSKTNTGTRPTSLDSDGDGLRDGAEVYPFAIIKGSFNWEQARLDAKNRGGRLAVIPNDETYQGLKRLLGGTLVDGAWVGASDRVTENNWLWYTDWKFPDTPTTQAVQNDLIWEAGKPDNLEDADAMWLNTNFTFEDAPLSRVLRYYIIEYHESDPNMINSDQDIPTASELNKAESDFIDVDKNNNLTNSELKYFELNDFEERAARSYPKNKDSDGDGVFDVLEVKFYKSDPLNQDTDQDLLKDGEERNGWLVGSVTYTSDPLLIDTDDDGFDDLDEKIAGTNPRDSQSRPPPVTALPSDEAALNKQVRLERDPFDVTIPQPFAPFGTRSEISRFGDDGSAMLVDVNGVLIWRDAAGANRQIPNSELHIPLVVSNSESIVWTNGFKDYASYVDKEDVKVVIYRADPVTGALLAPVPVSLQGKEILPTAPITTTSQAYHIVTSDHAYNTGGKLGIIFRIYRITYSGTVQLLGQIVIDATAATSENSLALTKVLGHGSDGSIIFAQDTYRTGPTYVTPTTLNGVTLLGPTKDYKRQVFWVDGVRPATVGAGIWEALYDSPVLRRNESDGFPDFDFQRVVYTSRSQAVYEKLNSSGIPEIFEARRNIFTGLMSSKDLKIAGPSDLGRILQISTQTIEGDTRRFYALNKANTSILVCKLTNTGVVTDYEAQIPPGLSIDETATVSNINRVDGSAVIISDNSPGILWLHKSGSSIDQNIDLITNVGSVVAKPLFVTRNELVLWNNYGAPVLPNGSLPPAMITHYWLKSDGNRSSTSLSAKIDGNYVMAVPPFTSAPETKIIPDQYEWPWFFTTVEKTGSATTRFRTYRLQNWNIFDEDGDGLGSAAEQALGTNTQDRDTDGDDISDGLEVQPFSIIKGNFSFEEARLDAIARGGWLARPDTEEKLMSMARQLRGLNTGMRFWIGGGDMDAPGGAANLYEGKYRWVDAVGRFFNTAVTPAVPVGANFTFTNWDKGQPSNVGNLDGVQLESNFKWSTASLAQKQGYILEVKPTNPDKADTDGDGLADKEELDFKSDPTKPDTDGDGLNDKVEKTAGTSPVLVDTDGDLLSDYNERVTHKTDPLKKDTDGDALEDDDEISLGTLPRDTDTDNDNLLDGDEVSRKTNPKLKDTDGDGLDDDKEVLVHKTNPLKTDSDGDFISDFDEIAKGSNPNNIKDPKNIDTDKDGLTNFDELFVHNTNPNKADTDGDGINDDVEIKNGGDPRNANSDTDKDGLADKVETRTQFFVSATNTGTDPYDSDSDNDGLNDNVETGTGRFVSMSNTGTNPNTRDTDGDGLDDKEETAGIRKTNHIAPVFTSSPFLIDTDGDLVGDFDESNARPKTNPRDPSKYPTIGGIKPISSLHALPVPLGDAQQVKINESFAPYGHRPDRDKVGDDGSGTIIDRNGVLIWTNKNGLAVTIPGSSLAKTLYVSNSECVVYKNRFAASYNSRSEKAEVVIYRRGDTGQAFSSKTITIDGTVLDTCPVTPTTYGFTLVTGKAYEDGAESEREYEEISGNPPVKALKFEKTDQWDALSLNLNRITWDGELKLLSNSRLYVLNNVENLEDIIVQGTGSDGSIIFKTNIGQNLYAALGQKFIAASESFWVSLEPGSERFEWLERDVAQSYRDANVAFLSNERALIERETSTGDYELIDWRQGANNSIVISDKFALPTGDRVLPVSNYSINGLPIYVHTTNAAKTKLNLYRADSEMTLLNSQNLTAKIKEPVSFVKNPRDASLLIKGEKGGLIWLPTSTNGTTKAVTGLASPRVIPNSAQGKPLFVTSKECVAWLNSDAPPLNGSLPPASISHFQIGANGLIPANITPPMEGNYVVFPTALSPDPDLEGWYLSTFEKDAPASTLMRTYQLQLAGDTDRDRDGISDYDELTGRFSNANPKVATDPMDPDTDDDGFSDGRELMPFVFVSSPLSWESARIAAINQGGKLAALNTANKQVRFQTAMKAAKANGKFWIGGHDRLKEGEFRWIANDGQAASGGSLVQSYVNWQDQQPSNFNDADAMEVSSAADFKWAMAPAARMQGYVIEYPFSNPNKADGSGDADSDGLADSDEVNVHKTNPNKADTDNDGLSDFTEAGVLFSNPLTGFLSGAPVTLAKASYEGLLYSEKNGLLGKISVNMENNGTFTGTYEIYNGSKSSIQGTLNKNNGLLVANSFKSNPNIGATTIVLQRDSQTRRNHLHVRVNNPKFGLLYSKARPAATGFRPARTRMTLEAPLSEDVSGPTGTMVAAGSITATGGNTSLQVYIPDGSIASSTGKVLDGGVLALYLRSSGTAPTHVIGNIKVTNVLNTKSNFDGQVRLIANEYDQERTLEGAFYAPPAPRTLPIASFNASNTANNAVFNWTGGELDKAYQVNSWRPSGITPPKTNYDVTSATFASATGLMKVDYTRSDKARNLYQVKSTAYAVVNQRKNTVNGFYSRLNWEGGSFSVVPNSQKLTVPPIVPPDAPIVDPGPVTNISPASNSVGTVATSYNIRVVGQKNWKVSIPAAASWVSAEVINDDGSSWADKLMGRDNATVKITVLANNEIASRTAAINIGERVHTLTQSAGQVNSIDPSSMQAAAGGNTYSIRVFATGTWRAVVPTPAWIKAEVVNDNGFVPSGTDTGSGGGAGTTTNTGTTAGSATTTNLVGQGNATINVTISPNTTASIRSGSILIGDKVHSITQRPTFLPGPVTSIDPISRNVKSMASTYTIRVIGKDNWKVALNGVSWLQAEVINDDGYVEPGNLTGSGNATIKVTVAANSTLNQRTGIIQIGDKAHTVTQAPIIEDGYVISIDPSSIRVDGGSHTYNIRVIGVKNWRISIPSSSSWLAAKVVNDDGFIYAAAPNVTGSGNATIQVTVDTNTTKRRRSGTINIGGMIHTCEQAFRITR